MHEIQVDIQDLLCLRTEVIDEHSHGVYKGINYMEHLSVVIPVRVSGQQTLKNIYIILGSEFYILHDLLLELSTCTALEEFLSFQVF